VLHVPTQEIIWAGVFETSQGKSGAATETGIKPIPQIASTIAQTYGLIASDMRRRAQADPGIHTRYTCINLAYIAMNRPAEVSFRATRDCLEKAIAENPLDAPAHSTLAFLFVSAYLHGLNTEPVEKPLERALALARTAVDLAPQKARPRAALFWTRFFSKRFDDAFDSASQIIDLNPNASDNLTRIGAAQILRGRLDEGIGNLRKARALGISASGSRDLFVALAAYEKGDFEAARRHVMPMAIGQFPLGLVLRIAVAERLLDAPEAQIARAQLEKDFPDFAADLPAALERYAMLPTMRDKLLADVTAAQSMDPAPER
jgi:tetratricopeptide (TPR) repeat protein